MQQQDVERIARAALRELGASSADVKIAPAGPGHYTIDVAGSSRMRIACSPGTTAEWVRSQIVDQFTR